MHTLFFDDLEQNCTYMIFLNFQSVGYVKDIGQVNIALNVLFKETMRILQNGHGSSAYGNAKVLT